MVATAIEGRYAYIADFDYGSGSANYSAIYVVDIQDIARPTIVGSLPVGNAIGIAIHSHYVFVPTTGSELKIIDVQNPFEPREVSSYALGDIAWTVRIKEGPGDVTMAYVGCWTSLLVFDVADPEHLRLVATMPVIVYSIVISGPLMYIAGYYGGLVILDISNPENPQWAGYWITDERTTGVAVPVGDYAYLSDYTALRTVDVRDPAAPVETSGIETGHFWGFILAEGPLAYVTGYHGSVAILDFSDPVNPRELDRFTVRHHALGLAKEGDILYVADVWGVEILDVSDPTAIRELGYADTPYSAWDVAVRDGMLYVASDNQGLQIINAVDPLTPFFVSHIDTPSYALSVELYGSYALIADMYGGLRIMDVSAPAAPREVWADETIQAMDVVVSGGRAYVADWTGFVHIYDLRGPGTPVKVISIEVIGGPRDIAMSGNLVFYASWQDENGLHVWDASDLNNPREIGYINTPGFLDSVAVSGNFVYGADSEAGIEAYDISGCLSDSPHVRPLDRP